MKLNKVKFFEKRVTRSMTRNGMKINNDIFKTNLKRRVIKNTISDERRKLYLIGKIRGNINKKIKTGNYTTDYLLRNGVLEWLFNEKSYINKIDKRSELDWGHSIIGYKTNQWTTKFGERCLYEILELMNLNPRRIEHRMKGENGKELVPDWMADDALYECKARTYTTTGSAGEKILGTPDKYKECYRLYKKPLKIVCMGYQEQEAEVDFCRFNPKSEEGKKMLDFYKREFNIEYVKATELLKRLS